MVSSVAREMLKLGSFENARRVSAQFWRGTSAQADIAGIAAATPLHQHQEWHVRLDGWFCGLLVVPVLRLYRLMVPAVGWDNPFAPPS